VDVPQVPQKLDRREFLLFLDDLHPQSTYFASQVVESLRDCGLDVTAADDESSISIEGVSVEAVQLEWGEPGILPESILSVLFKLTTGDWPKTDLNGMGVRYRAAKNILQDAWDIHVCKVLL
jgi:hypothetical protein